VLGLAVTSHLYPRLEAERFGAGRLTKIRAQSVSGVSCRAVAERLGVPDMLRASAPAGIGQSADSLVETERVLASVIEAVIGACYLHTGYERTAAAVVEAFGPEISNALDNPVDFKSTLQERLARRAETVEYTIASEDGPPHDRTFQVIAKVGGAPVGRGAGRSKKHAEQEAARVALDALHPDRMEPKDDDVLEPAAVAPSPRGEEVALRACGALTKSGRPCRLAPVKGTDRCWRHAAETRAVACT
jgi:ribonuclease-3